MSFTLPSLPYNRSALAPHMSEETLDYHYGKHHATYVNKLNAIIGGSALEEVSLEQIILEESGGIFNNAAQVWNHTFFWHCLSPIGGGEPKGVLKEAIVAKWGSVNEFKDAFAAQAINNFGSGWTWLVADENSKLSIVNTGNADTPITKEALRPLLTIDVWEHAYYVDHHNARPQYLLAFWQIVNWSFAESRYAPSDDTVLTFPFV